MIKYLPLQCLGETTDEKIFAINFEWSCSFTMKLKNEVHEALFLSLLVGWVATDDNMWQFKRNDFWWVQQKKEASCHLKVGSSYIRFNSAHSIYQLDGNVPKTVMSCEKINISKLFKFKWFKCVMFQDKMAKCPDDHFKVARYLDPNKGIGLALTAKIIKENSLVLYRSTYCALTQEKWE